MEQQHNQGQPPYTADDEIDLFELVEGLFAEKMTIVGIFLFVTLLAGLFAFLGPKTYEVNTSFLPPLQKDVITLSYPGVLEIDESRVYRQFVEVITSPDLAAQLSREPSVKKIISPSEGESGGSVAGLMKNISIILPTEGREKVLTGNSMLTRLSVKWSTSDNAYKLINSIIDLANRNTKIELVDDILKSLDEKLVLNRNQFELENQRVNQELAAEVSRLREADLEKRSVILEEMKLLREKAAQQRSFQISRLESDLELAKQLGITRPIDPLDYRRELVTTTTIDLSSRTPSRYWLGTEILEAEIQTLKSRSSDDPYIDGLSDLQKTLAALANNHRINTIEARTDNFPFSESLRTLKNQEVRMLQAQLRIQVADFEVVRVVETPVPPTSPIKPKKLMVLALGAVAGGMLGIMVALVKRAITNRRQQQAARP